MSRSSDGKDGRRPDGRRHNTPPEHSRVKPGQVLNPHGRKGKPKPDPITRIDELYRKEAGRIVSHDGDQPVDALERLVAEEFFAALVKQDRTVRARVLDRLQDLEARNSREDQEFLDHVRTRKSELTEQFYLARLAKRRPPDVLPHPDHVVFRNGWPDIVGPINHEDRRIWECKKACIHIAAYFHDLARRKFRLSGKPEAADELKAAKKHRAALMRTVPKGWNWKEDVYCRDSELEFAKDTIRRLKEFEDVPSADCD